MKAKDVKPGDILHWTDQDVEVVESVTGDDEQIYIKIKSPSGNETIFPYDPDEEA